MSARTRLLVLLVSAPLIVFVMLGGLLDRVFASQETYKHIRLFSEVISLVTSNYVEEVDVDKVMNGAMRGLAEGAGADSAYLTPAQVAFYQKGSQARGDIGVVLTRQYYLRVVAVGDNTPAARAGLRTGDYLRTIDDKPTREMSAVEGERTLRGERGSKVALAVIRGNAAEPHIVEVAREVIPPAQVTSRMAGNGVGYLRIPAFGPSTA
ncbi:MAG: PDZ domain-containing protein, partial [Acidobacteria bacterium]